MSYESLKNLNGYTCVVTGASGGVGFSLVERFAILGARVIAISRSDISDRMKSISNLDLGHKSYIADIRNSVELDIISKDIGKCDILVNSAGTTKNIPHSDVESLSDEYFDEILTNNLRAVYTTIRTFVPLLRNSSNGLIINISSASAIRTGGSNIAYASAKAGIESMTKNLALSLAPMRVMSICPGAMDTGFVDLPKEFYIRVASATPLKRIPKIEDVANTVEALATTMRYTTGSTILLDGGRLL
jgi:NAD(P)-dependent dehydrogenase (short-subunit alcohol dehydrogenase family)